MEGGLAILVEGGLATLQNHSIKPYLYRRQLPPAVEAVSKASSLKSACYAVSHRLYLVEEGLASLEEEGLAILVEED